MNLRPERDEWFFFSSIFNVTTRRQILNLYMFVFLETQETGAMPKRRGFRGKVWMTEIKNSRGRERPWEGVEVVCLALGRSILDTGRR